MKTVHFTPHYLSEPTHPITIALVGCGGTGSLMLARLARLDAALKQLEHPGLQVTGIDGDKVERHNVGRQNFGIADVGRYKASCLIEKVNFAFGLGWDAINDFATDPPKANIVITAVDSAKLRMDFAKKINRRKEIKRLIETRPDHKTPLYWLDTGNGRDFGQVILATATPIPQPKVEGFKTKESLPSIVDIYGDLSKHDTEEKQGMQSCSFEESIKQQDLFINDSVSVAASTLLWKLFKDLYLEHSGVVINQTSLKQSAFKI